MPYPCGVSGDQGIQLPTEETVELMQVVASELVVEGSRAPGQCRLCLGLLQYLGTGNEFTWDPNLGSAMEDHIDIPDMSPQVLAHMLKGTSQTSSLKLDVVAPLSATLRERCLSELLSHRWAMTPVRFGYCRTSYQSLLHYDMIYIHEEESRDAAVLYL